MPLLLVLPVINVTISYWMTGIDNSFLAYFGFVWINISCTFAGQAIGLAVGATFKRMRVALSATTVTAMAMGLVAGFYIRTLPVYVYWAQYISLFKYGLASAADLLFPADAIYPCVTADSYAVCPAPGSYITGRQILDYNNVTGDFAFNFLMIWVFWLVFSVLAYLSLRFLSKDNEAI